MSTLLSYSLLDVTGKSDNHKLYIQDATSQADIQTFVTAYTPLLDAVTGSRIVSASIRVPMQLPVGIKTDPLDDYFNRQGGNLSFGLDGVTKRETLFVPAYMRTLFTGEDIPRTGATDTLVDYILAAADATVTNEFDYELISFIAGKLARRSK